MSMTPKYLKGEPLTPLGVVQEIMDGRPIFERHKLQTPGWCLSWQLNYVIGLARRSEAFAAYANPEHKDFKQ